VAGNTRWIVKKNKLISASKKCDHIANKAANQAKQTRRPLNKI